MLWTILILLMTVIMGGIIAYYGDLMGRKIGKKRITLFGLRPRYTAVIITAFTGVGVSALTISIMFMVSPPIREVILRGERALRQNDLLVNQNNKLNSQNTDLTRGNDELLRRFNSQRLLVKEEEQKFAEVSKLLKSAQVQGTEAQKRLKKALSDMVLVVGKLNGAKEQNRKFREGNKLLADINVALAEKVSSTSAELDKFQGMLRTARADYTKLQSTNDDLSTRNETLTRNNASLAKEDMVLRRHAEELRDLINTMKFASDKLEAENQKLNSKNLSLTSMNKNLLETLNRFAPGYSGVLDALRDSRIKRVTVHLGDDIARIVVPARSDEEHVRDAMNELLHIASQKAMDMGAGCGEGVRAVQIVDRQFYTVAPNGEVQTAQIPASQRLDSVISRLTYQPNPISVKAVAVTNSVEGEPAGIELVPEMVSQVFKSGEAVLTRYFNANKNAPDLFMDIKDFLAEVGNISRKRGIIPTNSGRDRESTVGTMPVPEIVGLVFQMKTYGGRVQMRARAMHDIYAADTLDLEYIISP